MDNCQPVPQLPWLHGIDYLNFKPPEELTHNLVKLHVCHVASGAHHNAAAEEYVSGVSHPPLFGADIVEPSLRSELVCIFSPDISVPAHCPLTEANLSSSWNPMSL